MKKNNKKGFTLAELLIVVAIIGILVAISIPVFTSQLKKAKDATNKANARSIYAQLVADFLDDGTVNATLDENFYTGSATTVTVDGETYKFAALDNASATYTTSSDGHPVITYTSFDNKTETFGASGAESGESGD